MTKKGFSTRTVHSGQKPEKITGAHATPIFQTSSFAYGSFERGNKIFAGQESGFVYSRMANPTTLSLEAKMADLENAEAAIAFSSGMAAISSVCLSLLKPGDEILALGPLYGGTEALFINLLAQFDISYKESSVETLKDDLSSKSKMIYVETPTNPTLKIHDLSKIAKFAKANKLFSVVDNTFASPYLTKPLDFGIDISLHSATKYIGGHGDVIAGIVASNENLANKIRSAGVKQIGASIGPFESYLLLRGLKTLAIRMQRHCQSANLIAHELKNHKAIKTLHYPGLKEHAGHKIAKKQMLDFGGMLSFELKNKKAAQIFLDNLQLFTQAVSLGDVDSLATSPASTTHLAVPLEILEAQGVSQGLVRLSIGIENVEDLLDDIHQSLAKLG